MAAASCTAQQFQFNPQKQMPSTHTSFHSRYACALNCHYCARLSLRCSKRLHLAIACAANTKSRKRLKNSPPSPSIMTSPKKVLVPIGLGTEEAEAVIMTDVLRRAGAQVTMASVEPQLEIQGCNGLKIVADDYIASCEDNIFDLVLLPGGMPGAARLRDSEILQKITKRQAQKNRLHGAISEASALVLDAWGLLMGIEVACHPQFTYRTSALWIVNKNVHKDGMLITARGPGNATDLALAFVEQLFGKERCEEVRKDLVMPALLERESKVEEFNAVEWISSNRPRVLVPIANGSDEMEVAVIVDVLRRANAEVVLASIEGRLEIVGLEKVKLVADMLMEDAAISLYDLIVLPGGMPGAERLRDNKALTELLRNHTIAGRSYGAISASPIVVLETQGLLMDKKATAHPSFSNRIPHQRALSAQVVIDGKLITSRGPGTAMDFAVALVNKVFGHQRAEGIAYGMVLNHSEDPEDEGFEDVV